MRVCVCVSVRSVCELERADVWQVEALQCEQVVCGVVAFRSYGLGCEPEARRRLCECEREDVREEAETFQSERVVCFDVWVVWFGM